MMAHAGPQHADLEFPTARGGRVAMKHVFDRAAALAALVFLAPLMTVIAILIRLDGGPALFRQTRLGAGGLEFDCLKFRSMAVDAEARLADLLAADPEAAEHFRVHHKLKHDPRVTRLGRFLRVTSLDELPQLINVLRGEMSLVGPRPMTPDERAEYGPAFADYAARRPGITGLWQVSGRHRLPFSERARLDQKYAREWSLGLDLKILLLTVREVVTARGR